MPALVGADGYPLWDTFEASLFLLAGVVMGIVLGFLFPSLWRAFRRRYQSTKRFSLRLSELDNFTVKPSWLIEAPGEALHDETSASSAESAAEVEKRLVFARALGQVGQLREAVKVYLDILKSPQASSQQTGRIYFELAQVYGELGLLDRALTLAKEYQSLRPRSVSALELRTRLARSARQPGELLQATNAFRGNIQSAPSVALGVVHALCEQAEVLLKPTYDNADPAFSDPPQEIDAHLDAASRLAPGSLRLRHVRSSLSLIRTIARSQSQSSQLWVAFFSEISKRIRLSLEYNLAFAPSLELLLSVARRLASEPTSNEEEAWNAKTLLLAEWQKPDLQKRFVKDFETIAQCLILSPPPEMVPGSIKLNDIWRLSFPAVWTTFDLGEPASQEAAPKSSCTAALRVAITRHSCRSCRHIHASFDWTCLHCGTKESLVAMPLPQP